jgi:hypothetical protein
MTTTMTIEELVQRLTDLNGAIEPTFAYLDMIQNPEPGQQVDKDKFLVKAFENAERTMRLLQKLRRDVWESRSAGRGES